MNITRETAEKLAEVLGGNVSGKKIVFYHNGFGGKTETITLDYNGLIPLAIELLESLRITQIDRGFVVSHINVIDSAYYKADTAEEALALAIIAIKETEQ